MGLGKTVMQDLSDNSAIIIITSVCPTAAYSVDHLFALGFRLEQIYYLKVPNLLLNHLIGLARMY